MDQLLFDEGDSMARPAPSRNSKDIENDEKGGRPSPALIIGGLAIGIMIIIVVLVFAFSGNEISSVVIGQPQKEMDGLEFDILTAMNGVSEFSGKVNIEIYFEDMEEPIYTGKASVTDDSGSHSVDYEDFVWGNGDYRIRAERNGKSDEVTISINSVADSINPEWRGYNADSSQMEPNYKVEVSIGYEFAGTSSPYSDDPQRYSFTGSVLAPDGTSHTIDSDDFPSNLLQLTKAFDHTEMGTYRLNGTVINEFCHPNSPYRSIDADTNIAYTYDAPPFAVAGEDVTRSLVDGEATVTLDASGSWDDSAIRSYIWYIGDLSQETTSQPVLTYTFTSTGTYYIALEVIDDQSNSSMENAEISTIIVTIQ